MNSFFTGTNWFLAERFTDITKTAFVSLVYAAILPQGLFVSVLSFLMCFAVDKFCLLRFYIACLVLLIIFSNTSDFGLLHQLWMIDWPKPPEDIWLSLFGSISPSPWHFMQDTPSIHCVWQITRCQHLPNNSTASTSTRSARTLNLPGSLPSYI